VHFVLLWKLGWMIMDLMTHNEKMWKVTLQGIERKRCVHMCSVITETVLLTNFGIA
jgi:hypothetical protein